MAEDTEKIDSSGMEILNEFPVTYENDEELTIPHESEKSSLLLGTLDENIIIAYRSRKSNRTISDIVFEKDSISMVAEKINEILNEEEPWNAPLEFEMGKDKILITYSSSWAHNLLAPLERVNIYNRRDYELDGLRAQVVWLSVPPKIARKLAGEIKKWFRK